MRLTQRTSAASLVHFTLHITKTVFDEISAVCFTTQCVLWIKKKESADFPTLFYKSFTKLYSKEDGGGNEADCKILSL